MEPSKTSPIYKKIRQVQLQIYPSGEYKIVGDINTENETVILEFLQTVNFLGGQQESKRREERRQEKRELWTHILIISLFLTSVFTVYSFVSRANQPTIQKEEVRSFDHV